MIVFCLLRLLLFVLATPSVARNTVLSVVVFKFHDCDCLSDIGMWERRRAERVSSFSGWMA